MWKWRERDVLEIFLESTNAKWMEDGNKSKLGKCFVQMWTSGVCIYFLTQILGLLCPGNMAVQLCCFFSSPVNTLVSAPRCHTQTPKTLMPTELTIFSLKHLSLHFSGTIDGWWHHQLSTCSTWISQELFFFPTAIILLSSSSVEYSSKRPLCICLPACLHRFKSSPLLCSLLSFHSLPASRLYNKINSVHACRVLKIPILTSLPQYKFIITFFLKSFYFIFFIHFY